jgi:uncharacterized protein
MTTTTLDHSHADDRSLAVTVHIATLAAQVLTAGLLHVLVPAVALALTHHPSEWLREHAREQLNFQITYLLFVGATAVAFFLGFFTYGLGWIVGLGLALIVAVLFVVDLVCSVLAAIAASRGDDYRFPFAIRVVG